jgi:RNA-directed DNA polymerase
MKTYTNLYDQIADFNNLLKSAKNAQKGKRFQPNVANFNLQLESEILQLQHELETQTYRPGKYKTFWIYEPKERMISAAPYRDRVVHHALCNITAPIFENTFIFDTYANRKGKGTHKAIERYQYYAKQYKYVLKCDIKKFFPSIDHEILKSEFRWKIRCPKTLWLMNLIVDNSNPQEEHLAYFAGDDLFTAHERRQGLPIGNLTSQWWGNIYMNRFDHYITEELKVGGYIRYVDDFVIFDNDKGRLNEIKTEMSCFLNQLRLLPHLNKTQIHKVKDGVPFLGFHVTPQYRTVRKDTLKRYFRFLDKKITEREQGDISPQEVENGLNAWLGHIRYGQNERFEKRIFNHIRERNVNVFRTLNDTWVVLEPCKFAV